MEGINTDPGVGEVLSGNRDEAIAHVTAEVFYLLALRWRKLMEISVDGDAGDLVQDVDDGVDISIRDTAVILGKMLAVALGAPDVGVLLDLSMQIVLGSFLGRSNRMVSKTDWMVLCETQLWQAVSEKKMGSVRSRRMES